MLITKNFLSHVIQKEVAPKYDMRLKDDCLLFNFRQPVVLPHCSNPVTVTSLSFLIPPHYDFETRMELLDSVKNRVLVLVEDRQSTHQGASTE